MNTGSTSDVLQGVEQALHHVAMYLNSLPPGEVASSISDGPLLALENIMQRLIVLQPFLCVDFPLINEVIHSVRAIVKEIVGPEEERQRQMRCKGRPKIEITEVELLNLLELQFTQVEIAKLHGCSPRTIRRRILEFGLDDFVRFSEISNQNLDDLVSQFVNAFLCAGQKSLAGYMHSQNYRIQRWRIRESMLRVDPWGMEQRMRNILHRREYKVKGPNSLWHIDGNHKLIRWRIVIHGGVDGYSRVSVYLLASDNNRAETVLHLFLKAIEVYGLPSRVRSDQGGENTSVSEYMFRHPLRGPGRGSFIAGRSVHNQQIERFWRDMFTSCTSVFYYLFYTLEERGLLSPSNEIDLFCLHCVFLP